MIELLTNLVDQVTSVAILGQAQVEAAGIQLLPLVSRVLHILGALILGGGIFFLRSILAPTGKEEWLAERRAVWARWVGIATFLLLATGIYNFLVINGAVKADGGKLPSNYHALFGTKTLLGLVVMFVAAILAGKTNAAEKFREKTRTWLNVAWFAVMAILVIAAILRTMH